MLNSEEECDDCFGTQKFLNESDFSEKDRASCLWMRGFFYFCTIKTKCYVEIQMSAIGGVRHGEGHRFL